MTGFFLHGIGNSDRIPYSIKASRACKDAHSAQWQMVAEATAPRRENVPMAHSFLCIKKYDFRKARKGAGKRPPDNKT